MHRAIALGLALLVLVAAPSAAAEFWNFDAPAQGDFGEYDAFYGDEYAYEDDAYAYEGDEYAYEGEYHTLYVVNCNEYVMLRSAPSTEAKALARVPLGASVGYSGYDIGEFCEVEYDGLIGYVLSRYLSASPESAARAESPASGGAHLGRDAGWERLSVREIEVFASSEQVDQYGYYAAANANDANSSTTWAESASGIGSGEWLSYFFDEREVVGFAIRAGYQKSADVYKKNARPKAILVSVAGRDGMPVTLKDTHSEQIVLFDRPETTDYLSIELVSAYSGTRYADTCITDVRILLSDGRSVPAFD